MSGNSNYDEVLDGLNYRRLVSVLKKNFFIRLIAVKRWFKEVGKLCGVNIRLKISASTQKPYMTEGGEVGLSFKHLKNSGYAFFAASHEAAHFILMRGDYGQLKELDGEYPKDESATMRSPIEYQANILTLEIFERCKNFAKKKRFREKISWALNSLKEQIY